MPLDAIKPPARFPALFHLHLRQSEGRFFLERFDTQEEAQREARRWRAFIKSLREFPRHESALVLGTWSARTSVRPFVHGGWELAIMYRPSMTSLLESALVDSKG